MYSERAMGERGFALGEAYASTGYRPRAQLVIEQLRAEILDGRLIPGQRLRQEEIASRFGTSRIPAREALRQLESEGLVTLVPHSGARVLKLDLRELHEIYLLRERLDPLAIGLSAPNLSDEQLFHLRHRVEEMEAVGGSPSPARARKWVDLDLHFHIATHAAAAMPRLLRLVEGLLISAQPYRLAYLTVAPDFERQHVEHRLLLDALERRDGQEAELLLQLHIRRTRLGLMQHPEIFQRRDPTHAVAASN